MGSGRDKRKKAKGSATAGQGAAKTQQKTQSNQLKKQRRAQSGAAGGEDDIDAILAQLDQTAKAKSAVQVLDNVPAPGPRVCGLWLPDGEQKDEGILLFGGELWDRAVDKVHVYQDLYRYSPGRNKWTQVVSPGGPHPRSACSGAVYKGCLYLFGGEFTSPNQNKFKHFRDLWRLDLATWEWDELRVKGGPSARSGHRMLRHQNKIYLFGGYYDTGLDDLPKYYHDLWAFDPAALAWEPLGDMRDKWPRARSGFQWVAHGDRLVMHGGYAKRVDDDERDMEHGVALDDTWAWVVAAGKWERVPKAGMAPSQRASFAMVAHKNSAYLFGGAADQESKGGEVLVSSFFNELYQLNLAQGRWYPVTMRLPAAAGADAMAALTAKMGAIMDDAEAARAAAATRIQAHYRGHVVRKAFKMYRIGGAISEVLYSPAAYGVDLSSRNAPKPRARINPNAAVVKNTLWLFGGIVEIGDKEVTLDDLWSLDLVKRDGWQLVVDNTAGKEDFAEEGMRESSDDDDEDGDEDDLAHLPKMAGKR